MTLNILKWFVNDYRKNSRVTTFGNIKFARLKHNKNLFFYLTTAGYLGHVNTILLLFKLSRVMRQGNTGVEFIECVNRQRPDSIKTNWTTLICFSCPFEDTLKSTNLHELHQVLSLVNCSLWSIRGQLVLLIHKYWTKTQL